MECTIETPRLRLVPFARRHLTPRYVGWLNDPATVRYSEQRHRKHTLDSCRIYWRSFRGTPHYFWAIEARDCAVGHIGNMNAYVDPKNGVADIGILIGERHARGRGYALEAWTNVCRYLFEDAGLRKVTAGMMNVNTPMQKLARRAGMRRDGRRRRHCWWEGREVDVIHVAVFRCEWSAVRQRLIRTGCMEASKRSTRSTVPIRLSAPMSCSTTRARDMRAK